MKIINDGLPEPVFEWILQIQSQYSKGNADISVTELINPPKVRVLTKRNYDNIVVKASTLLNVTVGNQVHDGIETACRTGISERRLSIDVKGWKISGGMDHYNDGTLSDWKTANKWKTMLSADNGRLEEFENQLNVYAHILRSHDIPVNKLKVWIWFKDWNKGEHTSALKKGAIFDNYYKSGYPEREWLHLDLKLWSHEEAKSYIEERVRLHQEAEKALPDCSPDETWKGKRCAGYCYGQPWCDQYNKRVVEPFKVRKT